MAVSMRLLVLLAKFSDSQDAETQPVSFYEDLLVNRGTGGLNDYWTDASLGAINLDGSVVFGWFSINQTRDEFTAANPERWQKISATIAASGQDTTGFNHAVCLFNVEPNDGGSAGGVIAGPAATNLTFLAHETGHNFGLDHSYDESRRRLMDWSQLGEYYDPFDIMSAMNVSSDWGHQFSPRGPLLNTPNIRRMGWMPDSRIWRPPGINTGEVYDVHLAALESTDVAGPLMADIAFFTVEFRIPGGWDSGIPQPGVLIHLPGETNSIITASDKANYVVHWQPGQTFRAVDHFRGIISGPEIIIAGFDLERRTAHIKVKNRSIVPNIPELVLPDYIYEGGVLAGDGKLLVKVGNQIFRVPIPQPEIVVESGTVTAVRFKAAEIARSSLLLENAEPEIGMRSTDAINGIAKGV